LDFAGNYLLLLYLNNYIKFNYNFDDKICHIIYDLIELNRKIKIDYALLIFITCQNYFTFNINFKQLYD